MLRNGHETMMQGERLETFMLYKINGQPKSLQNRIYAKVTLPKIQVLIWTRLFMNYIKELIRILLEELIISFTKNTMKTRLNTIV